MLFIITYYNAKINNHKQTTKIYFYLAFNMNFKGKHIRVLTPVTTNGINPKTDKDDKVIFKTAFLPFTAKAYIERLNTKLPDHLKKRIEVVGDKPAKATA